MLKLLQSGDGRRRAVRAALLAVLVGVAAVAVYRFSAPLAAQRLAHLALERLASSGEWSVGAAQIHFEPFALAFDIENMQVSGRNGDVTAAAGRVRLDFSVSTLLRGRPALDRLEIRQGALRATSQGAARLWSLFGPLAADASVAALDAEVVDGAIGPPGEAARPPFSAQLQAVGLDLAERRGVLTVTARDALGSGSQLDASLTAEPTDSGAHLHGTATLAGGQLAVGAWRLEAPSAAFAVDALLSASAAQASLESSHGAFTAIDTSIANARFELVAVSAAASWPQAPEPHRLQVNGALAGDGRAELVLTRLTSGAAHLITRIGAVPAAVLAPYAERALMVAPAGGTVSVSTSIGLNAPTLASFAELTARDLQLAADAGAAALAAALLEEPSGEITINVPLAADRRATEQIIGHVAERIAAVSANPFAALAALVDRDAAELSAVEFVAGTAELTSRGRESLAALAMALSLRERVGVRFEPTEDTRLDEMALARSQVALHTTLATAQSEPAPRDAELNFASPRIQDVLDEFGRERLGAASLDELSASFAPGSASQPAQAGRVAYYRALFDALVAREPISEAALRRLAGFRARVVERLLTDMGIADHRFAEPENPLATVPLLLRPAPMSDEPSE